jgi:hypothetical protein
MGKSRSLGRINFNFEAGDGVIKKFFSLFIYNRKRPTVIVIYKKYILYNFKKLSKCEKESQVDSQKQNRKFFEEH